jgi:cation:H+ antiporter
LVDLVFVTAGLMLVLLSAGWLVEGILAFACSAGLSAFVVSVVFLGFDPENLAVGAAGAYEGAAGIALGMIVGSAGVLLLAVYIGFALGGYLLFGARPEAG